jgi:hypothetical protein
MADNESSKEMYFRHREDQDKYAYFLLAAAGSSLAFAVQKTTGLTLRVNMIALAGAAIAWIFSFYFGCRRLRASQDSMGANYRYLMMGEQVHPTYKSLPEYGEARDEVLEEVKQLNVRAARFSRHQFRWLIVGAVLFIAWHVWDMFARTFGASAWAN